MYSDILMIHMIELESLLLGLTNTQITLLLVALIVLALWDLVWKAVAMWEAAKQGSKLWFVLLLIINSVGILPIVYLWYRGRLFGGTKKTSGDGV